MAVRDDLRARRQADELANPVGRQRPAQLGVELRVLEVPCAGDVSLARVARLTFASGELARPAHVEDRQLGVVEPRAQLVARRQRVESRVERRLDRLELGRTLLEL